MKKCVNLTANEKKIETMRKKGYSFKTIGEEFDYTPTAARKNYLKAQEKKQMLTALPDTKFEWKLYFPVRLQNGLRNALEKSDPTITDLKKLKLEDLDRIKNIGKAGKKVFISYMKMKGKEVK